MADLSDYLAQAVLTFVTGSSPMPALAFMPATTQPGLVTPIVTVVDAVVQHDADLDGRGLACQLGHDRLPSVLCLAGCVGFERHRAEHHAG